MQYVSLRSSFLLRRFAIGLLCFCANTSQPAFGDEATVGTFVLTDAEISQRCAASIKGNIDMVDADEGNGIARRIPRCVFTYENMRNVAQEYADAEEAAKQKILVRTAIKDCSGQDDCVQAAKNMYLMAADVHGELVNISQNGESRLSEITKKEVVGTAYEKPASPAGNLGMGSK